MILLDTSRIPTATAGRTLKTTPTAMMDFWSRRSMGKEFGIVSWSRVVSGSCRWCGTSSPVLAVARGMARVLSQDERLARVTCTIARSRRHLAGSVGVQVRWTAEMSVWSWKFLGTIYRPTKGWYLAATCSKRRSYHGGLNRCQSTTEIVMLDYSSHTQEQDVA